MTTDQAIAKLSELPVLIAYLRATTDDEWQTETVRNSGNTKNCVFGHLVNWAYGKDYDGNISLVWDLFESMWATTDEMYEINDGRDPRYTQVTPRERCIAHLTALWLGLEVPTWRQMEIDYERYAQAA